jgi:hypothetical protein
MPGTVPLVFIYLIIFFCREQNLFLFVSKVISVAYLLRSWETFKLTALERWELRVVLSRSMWEPKGIIPGTPCLEGVYLV